MPYCLPILSTFCAFLCSTACTAPHRTAPHRTAPHRCRPLRAQGKGDCLGAGVRQKASLGPRAAHGYQEAVYHAFHPCSLGFQLRPAPPIRDIPIHWPSHSPTFLVTQSRRE